MTTNYNKFVPPQDLETQRRQQAEAERQQQVLELGDSHDSLGSLAVAIHEHDKEQERQDDERRTARSNELSDNYMNSWLSQNAPLVSSALAKHLGLPAEHKLITSIRWSLKKNEWEGATFTAKPEGMIQVTNKGKTSLWTTIDDMPVSAWFIASSAGEEYTVIFAAHRLSGSSTGFVNIERLGAEIVAYKNEVKKLAAQTVS